MRLVINTQNHGLNLSQAALQWLIDERGWTVERVTDKKAWGESKAQVIDKGGRKDGFYVNEGPLLLGRCVHDYDLTSRVHPDVIAAVETLGEKANTEYGVFKVVDIPDDVEVEINWHESGGEYIAEKHRVWE